MHKQQCGEDGCREGDGGPGEAGKEEERGPSVLVSTIQKKARKEKYMRDTATNQ